MVNVRTIRVDNPLCPFSPSDRIFELDGRRYSDFLNLFISFFLLKKSRHVVEEGGVLGQVSNFVSFFSQNQDLEKPSFLQTLDATGISKVSIHDVLCWTLFHEGAMEVRKRLNIFFRKKVFWKTNYRVTKTAMTHFKNTLTLYFLEMEKFKHLTNSTDFLVLHNNVEGLLDPNLLLFGRCSFTKGQNVRVSGGNVIGKLIMEIRSEMNLSINQMLLERLRIHSKQTEKGGEDDSE